MVNWKGKNYHRRQHGVCQRARSNVEPRVTDETYMWVPLPFSFYTSVDESPCFHFEAQKCFQLQKKIERRGNCRKNLIEFLSAHASSSGFQFLLEKASR